MLQDWVIGFVRDFDADGTADIIWRKTTTDVAVWLLHGTTVMDDVMQESVLGNTLWQVR